MKRFEEQLHKKAQSIRLATVEKQDLRDRVVSYMEYHPMQQPVKHGQSQDTFAVAKTASLWARWYNGAYTKTFMGASAMVVLMVIPVMAERAVPGDVLYSIKVSFNEEVRSSITRSPYQEIEWETERINRRLAEAQLLAREGRLTEEHEERVAEAVRMHSEAARESIERLRVDNADEAAMAEIALTALFDVHSAVLLASDNAASVATAADSIQRSDMQARPNRIAEALANSRMRSGVTEEEIEASRPSYQGLLNRIEIESARAYQALTLITDSASEEELTSISRRLEDVDRKVQRGIVAYEAGEETEARTVLAEALSSTRKVITFISNLEVRNTVALDLLIPIEYTEEEWGALLSERQAELVGWYEYLQSVYAGAEESLDVAAVDEINDLFTTIDTLFASTSVAIADGEYDSARAGLQDAEELLFTTATQLEIDNLLEAVSLDQSNATGTTATSSRQNEASDRNSEDVVDETVGTSSGATGTTTPDESDTATSSATQ